MNDAQGPSTTTRHDVVISPFSASAKEMVEVARCAEDSGFDAVWTYDHLIGTMLDRGWSHDPFATLGAIAAATDRVLVGPLVANMMNRHPAQLVMAMATLQSLSDGRAVLGLGSGASPNSMFGAEHKAIGIKLLNRAGRARMLAETIEVVRHLWSGGREFQGEFFDIDGLDLGFAPGDKWPLPIIIGASSEPTVKLAIQLADGVNINSGTEAGPLLRLANPHRRDRGFETSVHIQADLDHSLGGALPDGAKGLVDRRIIAVRAPFDLNALAAIGARVNAAG